MVRSVRNSENSSSGSPSGGSSRGRKTLWVGKERILPYEGKEKLPLEQLDSKGKVTKQGQPRHFVARQGNSYKLIRVYRAGGIKHSLVRMVKPFNKDKPEEKIFFQRLKKLEIPGAI